MKHVFGFLGLVWALGLSAPSGAQGGVPVRWPDVTQDRRDYQDNLATTDSNYHPDPHPAIEWPATPAVTHVAYIRGSDVIVKVRWTNTNSYALSGTLTWQAARLEVPREEKIPETTFVDLTVPSTPVSISLAANGGSQEVTLTLTGVPNYIAVGELEIKFNMPLTDGEGWGNNGTNGNFVSWERVCLLDDEPIGLQELPWTDFLEYTCRWAFGYTGAANVRKEMTRGMHYSNRAPWNQNLYNFEKEENLYFSGVPDSDLQLEYYLADLNGTSPPWVYQSGPTYAILDCRDFAAILTAAMNAHGVVATCDRVQREAGQPVIEGIPLSGTYFAYYELCRAGFDSSEDELYEVGAFNFHFVVRSNSLRYDSAASYKRDYTWSVYKNPVWEWPTTEHWQNLVSGEYRGLAYHHSVLFDPGDPSGSAQVPLDIDPDFGPGDVE